MKQLIIITFLATLFGCAGAPYEQYSSWGSKGYKDAPLGGDKHEVSFYGDGRDDAMKVKSMFLRRSAELAKNSNKKGFCIIEQTPGHRMNGGSNWPYHQGVIRLSDKVEADSCYEAEPILARAAQN